MKLTISIVQFIWKKLQNPMIGYSVVVVIFGLVLLCAAFKAQADSILRLWDGTPMVAHVGNNGATKWVHVAPMEYTGHQTIEQQIESAANVAGIDSEYAKKIAKCESGYNPSLRNWQGSTASGVFQFTEGTWRDGLKWRGLNWTLQDRFDADKNIDMAMWFVKREGWGRWACKDLVK